MQAPRAPSIWIDVEDIFEYFRFNPHPSGIQRVAVEIVRALIAASPPHRIRIARHTPIGSPADPAIQPAVHEVRWDDVEAMMATPPAPDPTRMGDPLDDVARRSRIQRSILNLPPELRTPLFRAGVLQSQVSRNVRALAKAARPATRELRTVPGAPGARLEGGPAPGDSYLVLGAPWSVPRSAAVLQAQQAAGVHTALLIHDLIPVRRPEWQSEARVAHFRTWLEASLRACDTVLTISRFTAGDVHAYATQRAIPLTPRVHTVPAGISAPPPAASRPPGFPPPGSYVLYVSTLESRKNHALAVAVWHKLMAEVRAGLRPAESVPTLVFAGRVGLGASDMLQQLDNSAWLNGRIRLFRDPTDLEVRALYDGCLFTLLPSFYEGWGLPLQESLLLGKPCLAADNTALPEAGGALCRYFDPEEGGQAHRAVAALLDDRPGIAAWQHQVRTEFRPHAWSETATAVLAALETVPA